MKIVYSSNNSGGSWWLSDEDWKKLEAAGWNVDNLIHFTKTDISDIKPINI